MLNQEHNKKNGYYYSNVINIIFYLIIIGIVMSFVELFRYMINNDSIVGCFMIIVAIFNALLLIYL